jgi:glucosamine-6-phosphate deaminase
MKSFDYEPSKWVPFRDKKVIDRVRKIKRADIEKHQNPDLNIRIIPDDHFEFMWIMDIFYRIKTASDEDKKLVLILPNPAHTYMKVAMLINRFRVDCSGLHIFIMDEYADQDGNIAPENFPQGFMRAIKNYFYYRIDEELRPPEQQIVGPTDRNVSDYGKMIADFGGADACYSGPGWAGHLAFIEPDAPEFDADLEEWKTMGPRIVTLSPFTIAQNSLHGSFGYSGDLALVPPKAFTIGPSEVIGAKYRMDMHNLTTYGTMVTWQRMVTRLCIHGPVTPKLPSSLHQLLKSDIYISETIAQDIEPDWTFGY